MGALDKLSYKSTGREAAGSTSQPRPQLAVRLCRAHEHDACAQHRPGRGSEAQQSWLLRLACPHLQHVLAC